MKKSIVWVGLLAAVLTTFNACKEDPDPIPLIVGVWERDHYEFTDLPANFQNFDGYETDILYSSNEGGYKLTLNQDGTYQRKIDVVGGSDVTDDGTWTHEGDNFTLKSNDEDFGDEEFKVEEEITASKLIISQIISFSLLPDAVTDTLSNEWYNAHWQDIDAEYAQDVDVNVLFHFEK